MKSQKLFNHLSKEHGLILLESELQEIIRIVEEIKGITKASFGPKTCLYAASCTHRDADGNCQSTIDCVFQELK